MPQLFKNYRFYILGAIVFIIIGVMKICLILNWNEAILACTAVVIFWYTVETRILTQHTKKQIEIETRPLIAIRWQGSHLLIKNIGRSPAFNIDIRDISRKDAYMKFDRINLCEVDLEKGVGSELFIKNNPVVASGDVDSYVGVYFSPGNIGLENYRMIIDYNGIEGDRWRSEYLVTKNGVNFEHAAKL